MICGEMRSKYAFSSAAAPQRQGVAQVVAHAADFTYSQSALLS